jgi:hypothetical protein
VVRGLLGLQAEKHGQADWAVAARCVALDEAGFGELFDAGALVRTHVLPPAAPGALARRWVAGGGPTLTLVTATATAEALICGGPQQPAPGVEGRRDVGIEMGVDPSGDSR